MAIKLNDILAHLKTTAAAMPGMEAGRVHLDPIHPSMVSGSAHIVITEVRSPGRAIDGGKSERVLTIVVGVLLRIDPGSSTDIDVQINAIYEPLHAQFESMRHGVANTFLTMVEDAEGPQSDIVDLPQTAPIRMKSCGWEITFERGLAATE